MTLSGKIMNASLAGHRRLRAVCLALGLALSAQADEHLDGLKVGSNTYSNVTVTTVSTTDIFFTHARGLGNAKLKDLDDAKLQHLLDKYGR